MLSVSNSLFAGVVTIMFFLFITRYFENMEIFEHLPSCKRDLIALFKSITKKNGASLLSSDEEKGKGRESKDEDH